MGENVKDFNYGKFEYIEIQWETSLIWIEMHTTLFLPFAFWYLRIGIWKYILRCLPHTIVPWYHNGPWYQDKVMVQIVLSHIVVTPYLHLSQTTFNIGRYKLMTSQSPNNWKGHVNSVWVCACARTRAHQLKNIWRLFGGFSTSTSVHLRLSTHYKHQGYIIMWLPSCNS